MCVCVCREREVKTVFEVFGVYQSTYKGPFVLCVCVRDPDYVHVGDLKSGLSPHPLL